MPWKKNLAVNKAEWKRRAVVGILSVRIIATTLRFFAEEAERKAKEEAMKENGQ